MNDIDPSELGKALSEVPLFREIQRVLSAQSGPVNWEIARQIARAVASAGRPGPGPTEQEQAAFADACRVAELKVTQLTDLQSTKALSEVKVLTRPQWAEANLEGFRYLIDRLATRLGGQIGGDSLPALPLQAAMSQLGPLLFGLQVGFLLGYLSHRVLGQYDLCLPRSSPGVLYFVHPNITKLERELELDPQQFRLWLALHEVTHVLEFESVGWTRPHFVGLLERYIDAAEMDSSEVMERLPSLSDPEQLSRLMEHPEELLPLMMTPAQQEILEDIQAFMSVLEGYGEWTMDIAGREMLPEFEKMREAITRMRAERSSAEKLFEALLGIDLKREQYRAGEKFVRSVAEAGKQHLLWKGPETLPTMEEIQEPHRWLERVDQER